MNAEEIIWIKSLKRVIKNKPESIEVLVHETRNNSSIVESDIHIMRRGVIYSSQQDAGDLMQYSPDDHSIEHFKAVGFAGNNHGY